MTPPSAVVDASVVVRWYVPDDSLHFQAVEAASRYACHAPTLVLAETANALWKYVRAERLSLEDAVDGVDLARDRLILTDDSEVMRAAQILAGRLDHPVYDCLYVASAVRNSFPLVTADGRLARKFDGTPGLQIVWLGHDRTAVT